MFLKRGDVIGVAAPSAQFDRALFDEGIVCLQAMGFEVQVPSGIFDTHRYLAGTDHARAKIVNDLFADPQIKGIISVRGGFGAMRILNYLDWAAIQTQPTLYMGFSDASALIATLVGKTGQIAVHGPNLVSLARAAQETLDGFFNAVTGGGGEIEAHHGQCLVSGKSCGKLVGGNLSTLAHMTGTPFQLDCTDGILFIEDVGEPAYKIDRMLCQMDMAGCFSGVQGVVAGSFETCANPDYIPQIITEVFSPKRVPVCMGVSCGHGNINLALPMGVPVSLDADRIRLCWEAG